jgi:hypothetical protein
MQVAAISLPQLHHITESDVARDHLICRRSSQLTTFVASTETAKPVSSAIRIPRSSLADCVPQTTYWHKYLSPFCHSKVVSMPTELIHLVQKERPLCAPAPNKHGKARLHYTHVHV